MMDWKSIVKSIAPTIGAALGGPMGGMAVKFLGDALLGDSAASESTVQDFILSANPDSMLKLKQLDNDFAVKMKSLDIDVFKLEVDDKKSARDMAKVNMLPQIILSGLFVCGYFVVLSLVLTGTMTIADGMKAILYMLIGTLSAELTRIMSFWFGSSMGSKEKTHKLGKG